MWELEDIFEVLEEPKPELTVLKPHSTETPNSIFRYSDQYLGGTTHIRSPSLTCIPIPGLLNLFCLPPTPSIFAWGKSPCPFLFPPTRWSLVIRVDQTPSSWTRIQ